MKAYKIVRQNWYIDHRFHTTDMISLVVNKFTLEYKLCKKTVPTIGKIFVFKTFDRAKSYYRNYAFESGPFFIIEGEAENCRNISKISSFRDDIEKFWKAKKNHKNPSKYLCTEEALSESCVCTSFTPTRILWSSSR